MERINVGIIGVGFIGKQHYEALRRIHGVHIRAIAVHDAAQIEAVKDLYDVDYVTDDWRKMVSDPEIQAIHNCTPNILHDEINLAVIAAGKHIYAEKPLSITTEGAKKVYDAAVAAGVAHGLNHQYRMNAAVQEMHNRIQADRCGKMLYVSGRYMQDSFARRTDYAKSRIPENSPARCVLDIGIHWFDTATFVVGMPIRRLYAKMITSHPVRIDPATGKEIEIHSDDTTCVMVEFEDGTPGSAVFSKVMLGHKNDFQLVVSGEQCEYRWEQERCEMLYVGNREIGNESVYMNPNFVMEQTKPYISISQGHNMGWATAQKNAVQAFYNSIRDGSFKTGNVPYSTFKDGWMGNQYVDACLKSSAENRWVELDLSDSLLSF